MSACSRVCLCEFVKIRYNRNCREYNYIIFSALSIMLLCSVNGKHDLNRSWKQRPSVGILAKTSFSVPRVEATTAASSLIFCKDIYGSTLSSSTAVPCYYMKIYLHSTHLQPLRRAVIYISTLLGPFSWSSARYLKDWKNISRMLQNNNQINARFQ